MNGKMRRGFSLLELVIVLLIVSIASMVMLPAFINLGKNSQENFENRLKTATSSLFSFSKAMGICADFKDNAIKVGKQKLTLPSGEELEYMVLPDKVVSSEMNSHFCISSKRPEVVGFLSREPSNQYKSILILLPTGEVSVKPLSEGEAETFKDKISKGRVVEWFNYFSY